MNDVVSTKATALEKIEQRIKTDNVCPALADQATQLVFGDGDPNADIVCIGEAPGKQEDLSGKPFVGAAGKLLDELLDQIELERSRIYITNIVKYRPPSNRDPLPEEKQAFLPYLQQQLQVIEPKVLVTLGRHSMEYFLPGERISQVHGKPQRIRVQLADEHFISLVIVPLYHPAAALYNGSLRQTLQDDIAVLSTVTSQLAPVN